VESYVEVHQYALLPGSVPDSLEGYSMMRCGSILQHMNEHTASGEAGGYLIEFTWKRPLRETARWVTGVGLAGVGVAIAVIGTASNSYLSMPLGIAIAVLGAIVLVLYAVARSRTKPMSRFCPGR
jgi:hypothetical protein